MPLMGGVQTAVMGWSVLGWSRRLSRSCRPMDTRLAGRQSTALGDLPCRTGSGRCRLDELGGFEPRLWIRTTAATDQGRRGWQSSADRPRPSARSITPRTTVGTAKAPRSPSFSRKCPGNGHHPLG